MMDDSDYRLYDLMANPDDIPPHLRDMPFTRRQHVINMIHEVESITGTKTFISIKFKNIHQRLWRSAEGSVTKIFDRTFPPYSMKVELNKDDLNLLSPKEIDTLSRDTISFLRLLNDFRSLNESLNEFAELETRISAHLLDLVSNAKDEGYNSALDVVLVVEIATDDTYDEEEVARAKREYVRSSIEALEYVRSSIEALSSQVSDDMTSSDECTICLSGYSPGMTVTRLPCSHNSHRECIERWLVLSNTCPICRSRI